MAPLSGGPVLEGRLGELSAQAGVYPAHLLKQDGEGLCLFAARFYGINDAISMARAGMALTLVDTSDRVLEMADIYPSTETIVGDAWEAAERWSAEGRQWDTVSADTYTGDPMTRSLASLELWCSLARDMVTVTHTTGAEFLVPDGWQHGIMVRSARANWLVLTRA